MVRDEYKHHLDDGIQNTLDTLRIEKYANDVVEEFEDEGYDVKGAILLGSGAYGLSHLADSSVMMERTDGVHDPEYQEASDIDMILTLGPNENYVEARKEFYLTDEDDERIEGELNQRFPEVEINPRIIYQNQLPGKLKNAVSELNMPEENREGITLPSVDGKDVNKSAEEFLGYFMQGYEVFVDNTEDLNKHSVGDVSLAESDEKRDLGQVGLARNQSRWDIESLLDKYIRESHEKGVSRSPVFENNEDSVWQNIDGRLGHKQKTLGENYERSKYARAESNLKDITMRDEPISNLSEDELLESRRTSPINMNKASNSIKESIKEALVGEHGYEGSIESLITGDFRQPLQDNSEQSQLDVSARWSEEALEPTSTPGDEIVKRRVREVFENHPEIEQSERGDGQVYRVGGFELWEDRILDLAEGAAKRKMGLEQSGADNGEVNKDQSTIQEFLAKKKV